ncbi:hypothetical protein WOC76_06965 [Methylocystis sp. IM3]|uniref:hypothetical protein n=1 Tax=unclassified Methylocystis TaxID=2625913 RepID=UPI0030F5CFC8
MKSPTQKILANKPTPYTVTRGKTGALLDKTSTVGNMPARAPSPQALKEIRDGRNFAPNKGA